MKEPRPIISSSASVAAGDESARALAVPLLLAMLAPLMVVISLNYLHSVWWTFALYQVGVCLVAPAIASRLKGRRGREHAVLLGLRPRPDIAAPRRWRTLAISLGLITTLFTGGFLVLARDRLLDPNRLETALTDWGVAPDQMIAMLVAMALLNAAAEELFWRGYLPGCVAAARPSGSPPVLLTVILPALLYSSYHALTIGQLVGEFGGVVLMTGGVLGAGLFWGWLRQRTGSVWPALMSHGGAVGAYLAVHYWLTSGVGN